MYNNTGSKIKDRAYFKAAVEIISSIVLGTILIVGGLLAGDGDVVTAICVICGLVIGLGGAIRGWNRYLMMAGFGELIEEAEKSAKELERVRKLLMKLNAEKNADQNAEK